MEAEEGPFGSPAAEDEDDDPVGAFLSRLDLRKGLRALDRLEATIRRTQQAAARPGPDSAGGSPARGAQLDMDAAAEHAAGGSPAAEAAYEVAAVAPQHLRVQFRLSPQQPADAADARTGVRLPPLRDASKRQEPLGEQKAAEQQQGGAPQPKWRDNVVTHQVFEQDVGEAALLPAPSQHEQREGQPAAVPLRQEQLVQHDATERRLGAAPLPRAAEARRESPLGQALQPLPAAASPQQAPEFEPLSPFGQQPAAASPHQEQAGQQAAAEWQQGALPLPADPWVYEAPLGGGESPVSPWQPAAASPQQEQAPSPFEHQGAAASPRQAAAEAQSLGSPMGGEDENRSPNGQEPGPEELLLELLAGSGRRIRSAMKLRQINALVDQLNSKLGGLHLTPGSGQQAKRQLSAGAGAAAAAGTARQQAGRDRLRGRRPRAELPQQGLVAQAEQQLLDDGAAAGAAEGKARQRARLSPSPRSLQAPRQPVLSPAARRQEHRRRAASTKADNAAEEALAAAQERLGPATRSTTRQAQQQPVAGAAAAAGDSSADTGEEQRPAGRATRRRKEQPQSQPAPAALPEHAGRARETKLRTAMLAAGSAMKPFFLRTTSTDKASDPSVCYFGRIFVGGPAGGSFSRDPHLFLLKNCVREVVPLVDKSKLLGGCAASEPAGSTPSFCFKILPRDQLEVHPLEAPCDAAPKFDALRDKYPMCNTLAG